MLQKAELSSEADSENYLGGSSQSKRKYESDWSASATGVGTDISPPFDFCRSMTSGLSPAGVWIRVPIIPNSGFPLECSSRLSMPPQEESFAS